MSEFNFVGAGLRPACELGAATRACPYNAEEMLGFPQDGDLACVVDVVLNNSVQ
jgi:hypothetical protein